MTDILKFHGIIPARYQSSRFPGKPLVTINGKPMIQRVYEQAMKSKTLSTVSVATDDKRIENAVMSFDGKVVMTSDKHTSGTERCYEAATLLGIDFTRNQIIINIQGDEPYIDPEQISLLASCFVDQQTDIATLIKTISKTEDINNPNIVKAVVGKTGHALYFSRCPIPYVRNSNSDKWQDLHPHYKHIGIYAYRASVLKEIINLAESGLENAEMLEQLRWLENGYCIATKTTTHESIAIDTPDDLLKINN